MGIVERKEREREARRGAILDAAESIFKAKGFANATMEDIAREAELAKGTIYLYYKSKEELQIGLVMRGLDLMVQEFHLAAEPVESAFGKLLTMGDAYWRFANTHPFYFSTMHLMDVPQHEDQIGNDAIEGLQERSNLVWGEMVSLIEQSKQEGMVRTEVNSFAFAILLWMDTTSTLRFSHKVSNSANSAWKNCTAFDPRCMDFRALYNLNAGLIFHQIVTEEGRKQLPALSWTDITLPSADGNKQSASGDCGPSSEELALTELLDNAAL
jgi:AcrR family transcriptional regulator